MCVIGERALPGYAHARPGSLSTLGRSFIRAFSLSDTRLFRTNFIIPSPR